MKEKEPIQQPDIDIKEEPIIQISEEEYQEILGDIDFEQEI